jgi:monoterpene epsilon-lactone hydrolase
MSRPFTLLLEHYRRGNAAASALPPPSLEESRELNDHWGDVTAEPGGVDYLEVDAGGVPALWAVPRGASDRVVLCLHGGGFFVGSRFTHRKMFAHLAKAIGARALILEYRRTPEHRHPAPVDDATAAYQWLLASGIPARHIAIAGDSAGGGLTVTTMLRARERKLPLAAALLPISAWVDMEFSGESMRTKRATDLLFGGERPMNLQALVHMFLGPDGDRRDPLASPIQADLAGLPPMFIQVSGDEMLFDDSRRLHERAQRAGVESQLDAVPGQQHTFQMGAGYDPVADAAIQRMAGWVRPKLGL